MVTMSTKLMKSVIFFALLLSILPENTAAQEKRPEPRETNEVVLLRAKLEQQEAKIAQLIGALKHQSDLIEKQDREFAVLREKIDRESKPAIVPASMQQP